jgi:tight adherence protein B
MLLAAITFLLTFGVVVAAYWLLIGRPEQISRTRLRNRLGGAPAEGAPPVQVVKAVMRQAPDGEGRLLRLRRRADRRLRGLGVQNGGRLVARTAVMVLGACALAWTIDLPPAVILGLAVVVAGAPVLWLHQRQQQRLNAIEELFPQAIELLARALRAGHAFSSATAMVAEELSEPIATEFQTIHEQQNFGMPIGDVLRDFADRAPLVDVRFFVTAVLTQRETGGNLSQVLDNLAVVMRDRFRVHRQLRALTAQGRMTGWVLGGFPIILGTIVVYSSPSQRELLLFDPLGRRLFMAAIVLQIVGLFTIRRIVRVGY